MIPPEILLKEAQLVQSTKGTILSKTPLSASVLTTTPTRPVATPGTHGARSRVRAWVNAGCGQESIKCPSSAVRVRAHAPHRASALLESVTGTKRSASSTPTPAATEVNMHVSVETATDDAVPTPATPPATTPTTESTQGPSVPPVPQPLSTGDAVDELDASQLPGAPVSSTAAQQPQKKLKVNLTQ